MVNMEGFTLNQKLVSEENRIQESLLDPTRVALQSILHKGTRLLNLVSLSLSLGKLNGAGLGFSQSSKVLWVAGMRLKVL